MVFQAFIDDSKDEDGTFVLAGHIAPAESWAKFARDWERMLPHGTLAPNGTYHFKMNEMAWLPERMARVPGFFRIIEEHVTMSVSCAVNMREIENAKKRIWAPCATIDWTFLSNPYLVAWRLLLDTFHHDRLGLLANILPLSEKVDFIFDRQTEQKYVLAAWDAYLANRSVEIKALMGATPRFEDDQDFLPLQAADFWAWWSRKWHVEGTQEKADRCDFGTFKGIRHPYPKLALHLTEDDAVRILLEMTVTNFKPGYRAYDLQSPTLAEDLLRPQWPLGPLLCRS